MSVSPSNWSEKQLYTEEKERAKMQAAKNAKEVAANSAASAKCDVEKTKATVDEKVCLFFFFWFFRQ
jgi:hypothetical protein